MKLMRIYDITQEVFGGQVYPGDPSPSFERVLKLAEGAPCNLTSFSMGAHNATHMDAPYHFYENGKTIEQLDLTRCVGPCTVMDLSEYPTEEALREALEACQKRILLKGDCIVTLDLARIFNQLGFLLVGVESQSVGPVEAPKPVHLELLGKDVILLEGIVLKEVAAGDYFLCAAPLKLGGSDGAPCRAILLSFGECYT
jgi:arylformamidase